MRIWPFALLLASGCAVQVAPDETSADEPTGAVSDDLTASQHAGYGGGDDGKPTPDPWRSLVAKPTPDPWRGGALPGESAANAGDEEDEASSESTTQATGAAAKH